MNINNKIWVIQGDGSALMGLGSMVTLTKLRLQNLRNCILDNNSHASTGGQKTGSEYIDFTNINMKNTFVFHIKQDIEYPPERIPLTLKQIKERFMNALNNKRI